MRTTLLAVAISLAGGAESALAQHSLPSDSVVRAIIRQRVDEGRNVGIVVGLIDADGRTRSVAYGRGAGGTPLDEHSVFEIGSITKTFTAALLADMVARGVVRLDQPVVDLLPKGTIIPSRGGRQITLQDLATHTSGLPRMPDNFAPKDAENPYADYDGQRLLAFLAHYELPRDIGAREEYSNLGVGLLGYALAAKAGVLYETLVTERVLQPLGLTETAITLTPAMRARLAPGHDPSGKVVKNWELDALAGAGALRSTEHDMLRYLAANIDPRASSLGAVLAATHVKRFQTEQPNLSVGLAWHRLVTPSGDSVVMHNGGTAGYMTFVAFDRQRRVGVVVLSNSANSVDDIGLHVLDEAIPLTKAPTVRTEIALSADALQRFVGAYPLAPTFIITVTRVGDRLMAQATGQPQFPLFAESETKFFFKVVDAQIEFEADSAGRVTGLVLVQNGRRQRASRTGASGQSATEPVRMRSGAFDPTALARALQGEIGDSVSARVIRPQTPRRGPDGTIVFDTARYLALEFPARRFVVGDTLAFRSFLGRVAPRARRLAGAAADSLGLSVSLDLATAKPANPDPGLISGMAERTTWPPGRWPADSASVAKHK